MVGSVGVLQVAAVRAAIGSAGSRCGMAEGVHKKSILRPLKITIPQRAVMWCISITTRSILMKF